MAEYDFPAIARQREAGEAWREIGESYGKSANAVRKAFGRWRKRAGTEAETEGAPPAGASEVALLTLEQIERITSLDDLVEFFEVDLDAWMVRDYRVNKWESAAKVPGGDGEMKITPLYQVRANLVRNVARDAEIARQTLEQAAADMMEHAPAYEDPADLPRLKTSEPVLFEVAVMDPHLGALAWGEECGEDYDLTIGVRDYENATGYLLGLTELYNVDRILMVVGNDTLHVDHLERGKVGTTTAGTPQDFDSRLPKLFTEARRAVVQAIDRARLIAPVDVLIVPGNHDEQSMYKLGEVLNAWYRNDTRVQVINNPAPFKTYQYGRNLFGFTHGEKLKRRKDPLALWLADEAPPEMWANTDYREIHCGHWHGAAELERMSPRTNLTETRGIRIRSLPGLTASDAWHKKEGYRHHRAATALAFKQSGGIAGLHEFTP